MAMALFSQTGAKAGPAAPLSDYERVLHESQLRLAAERARQPKNRLPARRRHRGAGVGTFLMCIMLMLSAAIGTQFYLGGPTKDKLVQGWNGSVEAAQYLLN